VTHFAFAPAQDREHQAVAAVEELNGAQIMAFLPSLDADAITTADGKPDGRPLFAAPVTTFAWAPDGSKLLAAGVGMTASGGVHVATLVPFNAQGQSAGQPLTMPVQGVQGFENPVYAPDGLLIAAAMWDESDPANRHCLGLAVMPADGSAPPRGIARGDAEDLQFSQNGQYIYFRRLEKGGIHSLYKVDVNGGEPIRISDGQQDVVNYALSHQAAAK
jgi:Tol biopolymer transport system component